MLFCIALLILPSLLQSFEKNPYECFYNNFKDISEVTPNNPVLKSYTRCYSQLLKDYLKWHEMYDAGNRYDIPIIDLWHEEIHKYKVQNFTAYHKEYHFYPLVQVRCLLDIKNGEKKCFQGVATRFDFLNLPVHLEETKINPNYYDNLKLLYKIQKQCLSDTHKKQLKAKK